MQQKPNFFIVGMARAGTTSLWEYLQTHPHVFMSKQKEPGFFDKDIDFLSPNVLVELERIPENICYFQEKFKCKIIFFEDFKKENEKTYKDILNFLEVDPDILPNLKAHNSSKSVKNYNILHKMLDNRILLKIRLLFSPNNLNLSENINKFFGGYRKRESLPFEIKEQLRNTFLPTVKEVEKITNRNLSHWYQ